MTDDRGRKTDVRRQKAEDRSQKIEDRTKVSGFGFQVSEGKRL